MNFLGFGTPLILIALTLLPVIWFLLRTLPPKPQREPFPPLNILRQIVQEEQTAHKTPWWLVLLRLILAALIIFALAQPLINPRQLLTSEQAPLVLIIDNGWAAQIGWQNRIDTAKKLSEQARLHDLPVYIITTADPAGREIGPYRAAAALEVIESLNVYPIFSNRIEAINQLEKQLGEIVLNGTLPQLAYLSDGLAGEEDEVDLQRLSALSAQPVLWYQNSLDDLVGLKAIENGVEAMQVRGLRAAHEKPANYLVGAYDTSGRQLGIAEMAFAAGAHEAQARFTLPLEMRNDIALVRLEQVATAGALYLTSSRDKRRRIALIGDPTGEMVQPLLTPLYYPMRALMPFGDIVRSGRNTTLEQIEQLLDANPALLVMGDEGMVPISSRQRLINWIEAGGTLLRFAGPRLAASTADDGLLPVRLRRGERTMGGAMSWAAPQKIAPIPSQSPLYGLDVPENVTINRQILAQPEPQLFDKSWLILADGTPLVTAEPRGNGRIIFIHTTALPDWSNLALSGFFVEMLQRIVLGAHSPATANPAPAAAESGSSAAEPAGTVRHLPPWRIVSADGQLLPPPAFVLPLEIGALQEIRPDFNHPPGLYGLETSGQMGEQVAVNLLAADSQFEALEMPATTGFTPRPYEEGNNLALDGILWALALMLFTLDCLIMLLLGKNIFSLSRQHKFFAAAKNIPTATASMIILTILAFSSPSSRIWAQEGQAPSLSERGAKTHLAYVKTGNRDLDALSQAGLTGLGQFIAARTTIEPGEVIGVDLLQDELSFYPLLYWPIDASTQLPDEQAIARLGAYMRQGGSVLFDTRDQLSAGLDLEGAATANGAHLRLILENLDIPALEPAPSDHVVARSFYIMPDFPGRYRGSDLWLEALTGTENALRDNLLTDRVPIVRSGDGVSPILITANDFIGAWAQNAHGDWFYPTVPDDPAQRLWAFRGGLNIVMYMLSGNYKADQVHAPELLRRLGE